MSRPSTVTVSRSKRGTTVKATGKAAQALFDAMTARHEAGIELQRPGPHTVHFEDHGQDFLEWDIDAKGVVVACRPCQEFVWKGAVLINNAAPGVRLRFTSALSHGEKCLNYPVAKVVMRVAAPNESP